MLLGTKDAGAGWKKYQWGENKQQKKKKMIKKTNKNIYNIIGLFTCKTWLVENEGGFLGWKIVLTACACVSVKMKFMCMLCLY